MERGGDGVDDALPVVEWSDPARLRGFGVQERVLAAAADQESGGSRGSYITKIQQSPVLPEVNLHNQRKNNR